MLWMVFFTPASKPKIPVVCKNQHFAGDLKQLLSHDECLKLNFPWVNR